jgi:hypothetical protein
MLLSRVQRNTNGTHGFMGDFWTLTAASAQPGYPASNLLNNSGAPWVSWGQRASHNWLQVQSDTRSGTRYLGIFGLLGIDRQFSTHATAGVTRTANTYRVLIDDLYPIATRRRPAVSSVSLTNLTGSFTLLNGPVDPPDLIPTDYVSTAMSATNPALNTVLVADFENFNATERPLSGTQTLRIHYRDSAVIANQPAISVTLRYSGAAHGSALTASIVEKTSEGFIFTYTFAASSLPGLTGRLGVTVTGTTAGGSTPIPIGLEWIAELSGWKWDSLLDPLIDGSIPYSQIIELPTMTGTLDPFIGETVPIEIANAATVYAYLEFSDFSEFTLTAGPVRHYSPAGGFQSAAMYATRLVAQEIGIDADFASPGGLNFRKGSDAGVTRSRSGSSRSPRSSTSEDELDVVVQYRPYESIFIEGEEFFRTVGFTRPFLAVFDETNPAGLTYFLRLTSWDLPHVGFFTGDGDTGERWDLTFSAVSWHGRREREIP